MRTLLTFLFLAAQASGAFSYYRTLTVDHTKCGASDSSNFPVLVSISHSTLKTVANGGHVQLATTQASPAVTMPADLVFAADSSGTTKYPWEVESYDGTNGILIAWVKIPAVSHTVDTPFYVLYGDGTISTAQNTGSLAPANVWDASYKGVWHLPNGTSLALTGSTASVANGTNHGATAVPAKIDGGAATTASQYISAALNLSSTGAVTVESWFYKSSYANNDALLFEFTSNGANANTGGFALDPNSSGGAFEVFATSTVGTVADVTFSRPTAAAWHHIAAVIDFSLSSNEIANVYIDGVAQTLTRPTNPNNTGSFANSTLYFMSRAGSSLFTTGTIDEVRVSTATRPADWILTEYNNQNAPGNIGADSFLKFGVEINLSPAGGTIRHRVIGGE